MRGRLRICRAALRTALAGRLAYRGDFLLCAFMALAVEWLVPLVTALVYRAGASFPGWDMYEVLLLQGLFMLAKGLTATFVFGVVWTTLERVREGSFDLILLKPRAPLFLSIATGFDLEEAGKVLGGLALVAAAWARLPAPGAGRILAGSAFFLAALLVFSAVAVILAALVIRWVGCSRVFEIFMTVSSFGNYPSSIFGRVLLAVLSYALPVTMMAAIPAAALLGRPIPYLGPALAATAVLVLFAFWLWGHMLKKYTSAGG